MAPASALTQLAYTTLSEHTYSLVANNLTQIIMEQTIYYFGVAYLRWEDKNGNIWEAVKEQVEYFGKDFFETMPDDLSMTDETPLASKDDYDYIDAWYEEHPNQCTVPFPEWI